MAYADRTFVTGPAHLAAVQLEERTAGVPRIVLDHDCVNLALLEISESGYSHPTNSPYSSYLLRDSDGRVFVSYLETAWEDAYDYPWEPADVLVKHRTWVEEMLTRNYSTDRVFEKYRWVAAYHNYVCDRWSTLAAQSISEGDRFKVPHAPQHEFTPLVPMD